MEYRSKAEREAEELRRQNEAESREYMRDMVANLQAELARYKRAVRKLAGIIANEGHCPLPGDKDCGKTCATCIAHWALNEASK